jgi:hypothetical protein
MSRVLLASLAVGLLISGIGVAGATSGNSDREKELLTEVAQLRKRVELLEEKLKTLEARPAQAPELPAPPMNLNYTPSPPAMVVPLLDQTSPNRLPSGTIEREFNGTPYYIIPIHNTGGNAASPAR